MDLGDTACDLWLNRNSFARDDLAECIKIVRDVLRDSGRDRHRSRGPFKILLRLIDAAGCGDCECCD